MCSCASLYTTWVLSVHYCDSPYATVRLAVRVIEPARSPACVRACCVRSSRRDECCSQHVYPYNLLHAVICLCLCALSIVAHIPNAARPFSLLQGAADAPHNVFARHADLALPPRFTLLSVYIICHLSGALTEVPLRHTSAGRQTAKLWVGAPWKKRVWVLCRSIHMPSGPAHMLKV